MKYQPSQKRSESCDDQQQIKRETFDATLKQNENSIPTSKEKSDEILEMTIKEIGKVSSETKCQVIVDLKSNNNLSIEYEKKEPNNIFEDVNQMNGNGEEKDEHPQEDAIVTFNTASDTEQMTNGTTINVEKKKKLSKQERKEKKKLRAKLLQRQNKALGYKGKSSRSKPPINKNGGNSGGIEKD